MKRGLVFKNLYEPNRSSGGTYTATNESMEAFNKLLGEQQFGRVAGICSGGEIGLFVLLPRTKRQLTLIDHNYNGMAFATMKVLLIAEVGGRRAHELITGATSIAPSDELVKLVDKLTKKLPAVLQKAFGKDDYGWPRKFVSSAGVMEGAVQREWRKVKPEEVEAIEDKLDLIEFVHGDLTDLAIRRPFDLLYLSNALEYTGRKGRIASEKLIPSCVKPGGLVLSTCAPSAPPSYYYDRVSTKVVQKLDGMNASGSLSWNHLLHKHTPVTA